MNIKIAIALIAMLLGCRTIGAQNIVVDSVLLSLQEAWDRASNFSKELQSRQLEVQIGEEKIKDAKQQWLPHISMDASYGKLSNIPVFEDGILEDPEYIPIEDHSVYDVEMEAYFNLYNGSKNRIRIKQEETQHELYQYLYTQSAMEVRYKVAQSYLDIQRYQAFQKLIEQHIYNSQKRLEQITKLYHNGVVLKSDVLRAELQLSQQESNLLKTQNNTDIAMQELNILLGSKDSLVFVPTDSIEDNLEHQPLSYQYFLDQMMQTSPYEKIAQSKIELSKWNKKQLSSDKLPKLGLFGNYAYSYPQIKLYPYANAPYLLGVTGIKLSYNFSALYHDTHKEAVAEITIHKQELGKEQTEDKLRIVVSKAYKKYLENLNEIDVAKINIKQAEENYRIVHQTYFNQLALLTDLLAADAQLLQARFNLINNQVAARLNYYQLLKIIGEL